MNGTILLGLSVAVLIVVAVATGVAVAILRQPVQPQPNSTNEDRGSDLPVAGIADVAGQTAIDVGSVPLASMITLPTSPVSRDGGVGLPLQASSPRTSPSLTAFGTRVTVTRGLLAENVLVAVFTDHRSSEPPASYQAVIWWGDLSDPSAGDVRVTGSDLSVRGSHAYATPGIFPLRVTITDASGSAVTVGSQAHIGSLAELFAARIGEKLLHRPITSADLSRWRPALEQENVPAAVIDTILHSADYQTAVIENLYRSLLRRVAIPAELTQTGGTPESAVALQARLLGSAEYWTRQSMSTNADFLAAVAREVFGREPDPREVSTWSQQLETGASRETIAAAALASPEARAYQARRARQWLLGRPLTDLLPPGSTFDAGGSAVDLPLIDATAAQALQEQLWQSLYSELYPILATDYLNQLVHEWQPPQPVNTSYPYWTYQLVGGRRALLNDPPSFEWVPVLVSSPQQVGHDIDHFVAWYPFGEQEMTQAQLVGVSGTAVLDGPLRDRAHPYTGGRDYLVSDHDVPFTHPLGNDVEFFVVPDSPYVSLLGPTNTLLGAPLMLDGEYHAAMQKALAPYPMGIGLSNASVNGVLGIEMDAACLPPDYRPQDGDRVAIFGRWIVDAGHADFHTEIHPPLLVVGARQVAPLATHSWLIGRAFLVSQLFDDHEGNRRLGLRGALEDQLTDQVTNFVLSTSLNSPTPRRFNLRPAILPGFASAYGTLCVVTMDYVVRPPAPRIHPDDRLLVSFHFTVRTGVRVYLLNTGDDGVQVVIDIGRTFYEGMRPPAGAQDTVVHVSDLNIPELQGALDQKRQEVAKEHGDDVGQFFQSIIDLGADTVAYAPTTWPQPSSPADTLNVVSHRDVTALPAADSFMLGQTPPAETALDDQQAFPMYGYVDLVWKRAWTGPAVLAPPA